MKGLTLETVGRAKFLAERKCTGWHGNYLLVVLGCWLKTSVENGVTVTRSR